MFMPGLAQHKRILYMCHHERREREPIPHMLFLKCISTIISLPSALWIKRWIPPAVAPGKALHTVDLHWTTGILLGSDCNGATTHVKQPVCLSLQSLGTPPSMKYVALVTSVHA
jgi:hypothetical protein